MKIYQFSMRIAAVAVVALGMALASCSDNEEPAVPDSATQLVIDSNCEIYEIKNAEGEPWEIVSAPGWVTPVNRQGNAGEAIRVYVESNSGAALREGKITIQYAGGRSSDVEVSQSDTSTRPSLQRTYAAGWSLDVRTYMDFRGLKEQVLNTQKLYDYDPNKYYIVPSTTTQTEYYYGESSSDLSDSMSAKLELKGKYNSFTLDVQGSFGKSALNTANRIFCRIRSIYCEREVGINNLDPSTAQKLNLFTEDFAAERQKVIDADGSDESIRHLIERYGTHVVMTAYLGGFYDYFFSSVVEDSKDLLNVEGAVKFGFSEKFNLKGDATYKDDFAKLNKERIEKFLVKGGDAIDITSALEHGSLDKDRTDAWLASLRDQYKYELLGFNLQRISRFFPRSIAKKIDAYTDRMYYSEVSLTRSTK